MAHNKSIFEELAPFASMVVDQGRGVVVSDLAFASAEDRYSTAFITLGAAATLPSNSTVKLFQSNIGQTGQGSPFALTVAETNNTNGDRQPSNQVYIATHFGFQLYAVQSGQTAIAPLATYGDAYKIAAGTTWNLTIGDGIKRTLGTVLEYPSGSGIDTQAALGQASTTSSQYPNNGWVGCSSRKLPIPVIFPPNIQVDIELKTGNAQPLEGLCFGTTITGNALASGDVIAYRATFHGFRMTLPA